MRKENGKQKKSGKRIKPAKKVGSLHYKKEEVSASSNLQGTKNDEKANQGTPFSERKEKRKKCLAKSEGVIVRGGPK